MLLASMKMGIYKLTIQDFLKIMRHHFNGHRNTKTNVSDA